MSRKKTMFEVLAERSAIVVLAYDFGFVPWGFLVLVDYISGKWKSVRRTRRIGYSCLFFSIGPMLAVVAYAAVHGLAQDYQEMMTAASALVLTLYCMARTIWGLAQLRMYKTWCSEILACVTAAQENTQVEEEEINLDTELQVNNDVIDNEFIARDVELKLDISHMRVYLKSPVLCTVRWAGAFLCSLGNEWRSTFPLLEVSNSISDNLFWSFSHIRQFLFLEHAQSRIYSLYVNLFKIGIRMG